MPVREFLQRVALAAYSARIRLSSEPVYVDVARAGALVGLLGNPPMRRVSAAAVRALGGRPTTQAVWRFAREWWYQRAVDELLAYQADRLTPAWLEQHVSAPDQMPADGCILLSIHQSNQRLAFARFSLSVKELACVSMWAPLPATDPNLDKVSHVLDPYDRKRSLSRFSHRFFGEGVLAPNVAPRRGLELLQRGGSLIVLADFFGQKLAPVLGREIPVADGVTWWAEKSGRPIVPFLMSPPQLPDQPWQLRCGQPIPPTRTAVIAAVEDSIRQVPTTWMSWRGWYESPPAEMSNPINSAATRSSTRAAAL